MIDFAAHGPTSARADGSDVRVGTTIEALAKLANGAASNGAK